MRVFIAILILLSLAGCGVDSSSGGSKSTPVNPTDGTDDGTNDGTDDGTNDGTNDGTDDGTNDGTDDGTNDGTDDGTNDGTDDGTDVTDPIFDDSDGAVYDADACTSSVMNGIPLQDTANTVREEASEVNGVAIKSLYPETTNELDSNVVLYYNALPTGSTLQDDRTSVYGDNSNFILSYDLVWTTIANNTMYVKTPKLTNELQSCYRVTADSQEGSSITPVKVYR